MTDMQIKYMRTAAETPKLQAESQMAQDYLKKGWNSELNAKIEANKAQYYKNLGDKELAKYFGEWWDNGGRGRGSAYHNWWNPYTNTAGVGRANFDRLANFAHDDFKTYIKGLMDIAASIVK